MHPCTTRRGVRPVCTSPVAMRTIAASQVLCTRQATGVVALHPDALRSCRGHAFQSRRPLQAPLRKSISTQALVRRYADLHVRSQPQFTMRKLIHIMPWCSLGEKRRRSLSPKWCQSHHITFLWSSEVHQRLPRLLLCPLSNFRREFSWIVPAKLLRLQP